MNGMQGAGSTVGGCRSEQGRWPATILFHESYFRSLYGAQTGLLNLLEHLDRDRFRPLVVCPGEGAFTERVRELGVEVLSVPLPPALSTFGGSLLRASPVEKAWRFLQLWPQVGRLARLIRQRAVCLMHCNTVRSVLSSGWAARLSGVPLVWHVKGDGSHGVLDAAALRISDRLIAISEDVRASVERRFPSARGRVVTVRDGIPTDRFRPDVSGHEVRKEFGFQNDEVVVGTVGALVPRKGFEVFLDVARRLAGECPAVRFLVVGDISTEDGRPYKEHLLRLGADLMREGKLVFAGWRDDMPQVYAAIDVLGLASSIEGLALVVIEAMATGKPVVRTAAAGAEDTVVPGETGYVVPVDDATALADALKRLVNEPERRRRMGARSRERVTALFSAEAMARGVERVFTETLERHWNGC
jgi:glycosyltransferase involved in cell wall biosynthesis